MEKVVFPEKSGQNVGFHNKSQGQLVHFNQKSREIFQKVPINLVIAANTSNVKEREALWQTMFMISTVKSRI